MSQENVSVIEQVYERVTANFEMPPELFDADLVLDAREVAPDFGVVNGLAAAQAQFRQYWDVFDAYHVGVAELLHADDTYVVNAARDRARVRGSDAEVSNRYFHAWTFDAGKIVRMSIHSERANALKAVGLEE